MVKGLVSGMFKSDLSVKYKIQFIIVTMQLFCAVLIDITNATLPKGVSPAPLHPSRLENN